MAMVRNEALHVDLRVIAYVKDEIAAMLDRVEVDLTLGVFAPPSPNAVATALFQERFVGIARHDHPALKHGRIAFADFAAAPHALVSVRRYARGAIDVALERLGLRRRVALVVPYMLMLPRVLSGSDLIAVLPSRAAAAAATPGLA